MNVFHIQLEAQAASKMEVYLKSTELRSAKAPENFLGQSLNAATLTT